MKSLARNIIRAWVPEADDRPYLLTGIRNSPKKKVDGGERRERERESERGSERAERTMASYQTESRAPKRFFGSKIRAM